MGIIIRNSRFFRPELSRWPLWFLLPNAVRTYTWRPQKLASEGKAFWAIPGQTQSHTAGLESPGRTPVSTKLQIEFPPLGGTFVFGNCCPSRLFRGWVSWQSYERCPSFPQWGRRGPCYPGFHRGFCQSRIGGLVFIGMGRRVRLDSYLAVPLVLFQSYFEFW